ncbi:hypothetical protein KUTeg_016793 [Tegillarca granosa]|uniref:t-SNARE coiled-coil homology domain-containing protein n=1 Tax=Tegillarca granosa TaxID=220873 RepID=A0ABQ9ELZ5_TEGGR|nr:hypothetical protein KUTeg_016793 [Tegillarca granosa]
MVKDRLAEMKAKSEEFENEKKKKKIKKEKEKSDAKMAGFLGKVKKIEADLQTLRDDVSEIKKVQGNLYCSPFVKQDEIQKMESQADQILNSSIKIRKDIELLSADYNSKAEDASLITSNVHQRVHSTQIDRLSSELRTVMNDFRTGQADYIDKTKARFKRQKLIVNGEDSKLDINYENETLFTGGVSLVEMQKAKGELQDLYEREKELQDLESQIHEVNKLFKAVGELVADQGETIDSIEKNVTEAVEFVQSGNDDLEKAKENQRKARRKKLFCIGILIAVLVVVAIILAIVFGSQNSS